MVHLTTALEPGSGVPLYEQLYRSLAGEMRTGALPAGTRMPGKRRLAAELSVSVNTVDTAYQMLAAEGYLAARRSGFYVQEYLALPQVGPDARGPSPAPAVPEPAAPEPPVRYDLSTRGVDPGLFPFRTWARLQKELLYSSPELLTNGDAQGDLALRQALADYLADEFKRTEKIDLKRDKAAMLRVREAAEKAKRELSGQMSTQVTLPFLTQDANGPHHLDVTVTRAQFEGMTRDLVERTCGPVSQVMTDAALSMSELGQVLLVGGSTRMPAVQEMVKKLTGKTPARNVNPDECVAMGAALQGGKLAAGNGMTVASAAQSVILMDVAPLSLSIETVGGVATKIIDRNTTIPTRFSKVFTTAAPFQTAVDIKVLQGERYYARDNKLLGNFRLKGIRRAMAGVPQIEVTFAIDANGIVTVSAKDLGTGNQQEITISSTTNMSEDEIRRAMEDARRYEAQDKARKEASGIRNEAEKLIYETEQALGRDKTISHEDKKKVKDDISALRKAVNKTKPESITTEQAAEIARLAEALKQSAKAIRTEE